jgi:hypothetical protein
MTRALERSRHLFPETAKGCDRDRADQREDEAVGLKTAENRLDMANDLCADTLLCR